MVNATSSVVNTPTKATTTIAAGNTDQAVATGNTAGGSPSGTMSFFVCGPMAGASGCPSGGQAVGSQVPVAPGSGNRATATSAKFIPPSAGVWCFRAEYPGDGNYTAASDGSPGGCFTVLQPGAPSATIASPTRNVTYGVGRVVHAGYSCSEAPGGPGVSSCSGPVPSGAQLDTSTRGQHTFGVTAVSKDGLRTTVFASYTVAGPPSVSISSPVDGASFTLGESIGVAYGCGEDGFGPGLVSCSGPTAVNTNATGTFAFTVTATSIDGESSSRTVHYNVVTPSNRFVLSHLQPGRDGRVTFRLAVPGGGGIKILETAPRRALPRPKPGRLVFARLCLTPKSYAVFQLTVRPAALGMSLVRHHRFTVRIQLTVTFTPVNGTPRSSTYSGLRVTQ